MKIAILPLFVAFFLSLEFHFYLPVALCLTLAVAFIAVSSLAAARAVTAHLR
jgi:hypothetical protein